MGITRLDRVLSALVVCCATLCPRASGQTTTRVSVGAANQEGNDRSDNPSISGDGRYVTFATMATNLGVTDLNGTYDVYLRDRELGQTTLLSRGLFSNQTANSTSVAAKVAGGGSGVVFESDASNLVFGDSNGYRDIFYKDLASGVVERVSVGANGAQANDKSINASVSDNGRYIAFVTDATNLGPLGARGVYVRDRQSGVNSLVSVSSNGVSANNVCTEPHISSDGRYVVFASYATNLVSGDTNGTWDVFVHDRQTAVTRRASVSGANVEANGSSRGGAISSDGRYVVFESLASNLSFWDVNGSWDIFRRDLVASSTTVITVSSAVLGTANGDSRAAAISHDGRTIVFESEASDLLAGDSNAASDVFLKDVVTSSMTRVSLTQGGGQGNSFSWMGQPYCMSFDARFLVFHGVASNLVPFDGNNAGDVFVRDRTGASVPYVYGVGKANSLGCAPAMSFTGVPSASAASGFHVKAANVLNQKIGHLFYGTNGPLANAFQGGFLYVAAPTHRTPNQNSLGSPSGNDCTGHFDFDFNAWMSSGVDPTLVAGVEVRAQYWSRDPAMPSTTSLTDAIAFTIQP
jgi:Tol biopolymer transport system component